MYLAAVAMASPSRAWDGKADALAFAFSLTLAVIVTKSVQALRTHRVLNSLVARKLMHIGMLQMQATRMPHRSHMNSGTMDGAAVKYPVQASCCTST